MIRKAYCILSAFLEKHENQIRATKKRVGNLTFTDYWMQ